MKQIKFCLFLLFIASAVNSFSEPVGAVFVPQRQFDDVEYLIATSMLDSAGITYYVFSENDDTCRGMTGFNTLPYASADSVGNLPMDFLLIIGGTGITYCADDKRLHSIISRADSSAVPITAAGFAPVLLMKSSMLRGREINFVRNKMTQSLVEEYGVKFKSEALVISENLITSPSSQFVRYYITELLRKVNEASSSKGE